MPELSTTLLLVDGHRPIRDLLAGRFRRVPSIHAVHEAPTVGAGILLAHEHAPRLVLFDPRTTATDAALGVRLLAEQGRRVLVFTSSLFDGDEDSLVGAGCAGIAYKGMSFASLLSYLESLLTT